MFILAKLARFELFFFRKHAIISLFFITDRLDIDSLQGGAYMKTCN